MGKRRKKIMKNKYFIIISVIFILTTLIFGNVKKEKKVVLKNGLTLCVIQDPDSPVIAIHILFKNRSFNEGKDMSGMVDLIHRMFVTENVRKKLLKIGAEIQTNDIMFLPFDDYYTTNEFSFVRFKTLNEFYDEGLKLLANIITHPNLSRENFNMALKKMKRAQMFYSKKPQKIGMQKFFQLISRNSYLSFPIYGNRESLNNVRYEKLTPFYKKYFSPENTIMTIYTSTPIEKIECTVKKYFETWGKAGNTPTKFIPAKIDEKVYGKEVIVKSSAPGIGFICGGYDVKVKEKDKYPLTILMSIFSDNYSFLLREKYGLAYSIGANFTTKNCGKDGIFLSYIITEKKNIPKVIKITKEFVKEFETQKMSEKELEIAKNKLIGKLLRRFIPSLNKTYFMGLNIFCGKECYNFLARVNKLKKITLKDVIEYRKKYFSHKKFNYVIVN